MKNNFKVIIFDIDGTLIDTDELIINSYRALFKKFRPDYVLTKEEEISFLGPTLASMFPKYFKEDFDTLLEVYRDFSHGTMKEYAYVYNHAEEVLRLLKEEGYKLAVVTSRFRSSVLSVLDEFDLTKYFEYIVALDDVEKPKPSPEGLNKCIEHFNVTKEECLYIGDNESDYKASKNAGVKCAMVAWAKGRNNASLDCEYLIDSYLDLKKIVNLN